MGDIRMLRIGQWNVVFQFFEQGIIGIVDVIERFFIKLWGFKYEFAAA